MYNIHSTTDFMATLYTNPDMTDDDDRVKVKIVRLSKKLF